MQFGDVLFSRRDRAANGFCRIWPRLANAEVGVLLVWMNDQDVAVRLARHRLTDALTE